MKRFLWLTLSLSLVFAGLSLGQVQGPLTNALNLGLSKSGDALRVYGVAAGAQGPLTNLGNLRLRAHSGALDVSVTGGVMSPDSLSLADGTFASPALFFASDPDVGVYRSGTNLFDIVADNGVDFRSSAGNPYFKSTWSSGGFDGSQIGFYDAAGSLENYLGRLGTNSYAWRGAADMLVRFGTSTNAVLIATAPPTISGFAGSSPAATVTAGSTVAAWRIGVGGTAPGTSGTLTLPATTTGWNCWMADQTTPLDITRQTASTTTSVTITSTIAWTANDVLVGGCMGF